MSWPEVVLAAIAAVQVVVLAALAIYERRTSRTVDELNGDVKRVVDRDLADY